MPRKTASQTRNGTGKKEKKRAEKRSKKQKSSLPAAQRWRSVSAAPGLIIWGVVWLAGLLFTQFLRSPASNIFFGFISFLPVASLLYSLIARRALKLYMISEAEFTEKNADTEYHFRLINESILPFPFIDAYFRLPLVNSVRTAERCVKISMAPLSDYEMKNPVKFRFRGTYEIGVSCLYVYDFFRMIRVRVDIESFTTVYVLPRKLVLEDDTAQTVSDSAKQTKKSPNSYEKIEVSDIRDYRLGDPLKSIHWKLSSKTEDLIVKDYNSGTTDITYILADLSVRFPTEPPEKPFVPVGSDPASQPAPDVAELVSDEAYEDMNEYCADGVVELTVASVLKELRSGRTVNLMWFDERSEIGAYFFELRSSADFDTIFRLFATAPVAPAEKTVAGLSKMIGDSEDAKFVFVLPTLDTPTVTSLCTMPCASDSGSYGENEVVVYDAQERFAHPKERGEYIEGCRAQLAEHGLMLIKGSLDGLTAVSEDDPRKKSRPKGE